MSDKLEAYLEEISHFLSGRAEREEILSEIRSHIAEKAAEGPGEFTDAAIERAIAAFGPARKVAERYARRPAHHRPGLQALPRPLHVAPVRHPRRADRHRPSSSRRTSSSSPSCSCPSSASSTP